MSRVKDKIMQMQIGRHKTITVKTGRLELTEQQGETRSATIVVDMDRAECLALATAIKESAPKHS